MFRKKIPIPALAMVDCLESITICNSINGIEANVKTDEFIKRKKMESQVGEGKCQWLHCGSDKCRSSYVASRSKLDQCQVYKYLGDHMSDGLESLYQKRLEKCIGYSVCGDVD